jgi:methylmalonyl-CoA mutase cobalamin-binding domain/chain
VHTSLSGNLKGPVILGNIEDDCHPLGRKIVASFLRLNGWDVRDLGIDVEAGRLVDEAILVGAKVIGVSAMIFTTARNIRKVREEIDRRGLTGMIMLAVGGAVFHLRPELVQEVGGDGTADNAFAAVSLFERLWKLAEEGGGQDER